MTQQIRVNDQYCVFQADGAVWAVPAASVREITDAVPIVKVPESPPQMVGVCHVRMEFVPVLNLQGVIGEWGQQSVSPEYLLIFDGSEGPWALQIQRALSLQTLEIAINGSGQDGSTQNTAVLGTATFADGVIRIIDPATLYRSATEILDAQWGNAHAACGDQSPVRQTATVQ